MSEDKLDQASYASVQGADEAPLVGGFSYDGSHDRWTWSPEVFQIHGFEPHDVVPTTQLIRFHAHPDDRDAVADTLAGAMESPGSVHPRLPARRRARRHAAGAAAGDGLDAGRHERRPICAASWST